MISAADGIVHYDVTRIALIEALGDMPLGAYLTLEARARFADALLAQMPVASDAGFYMEGVKAERERIAELAEEHRATYDLTKPCGCGRTDPRTGDSCTALIASGQSFAVLILEQP